MKSTFEGIFIQAIKDGEDKDVVLKEIQNNITSHKRVIESINTQIMQKQIHKAAIEDDIDSLTYQMNIILGREDD